MQIPQSNRFTQGLFGALEKHKQVDGAWVPTSGEAGGGSGELSATGPESKRLADALSHADREVSGALHLATRTLLTPGARSWDKPSVHQLADGLGRLASYLEWAPSSSSALSDGSKAKFAALQPKAAQLFEETFQRRLKVPKTDVAGRDATTSERDRAKKLFADVASVLASAVKDAKSKKLVKSVEKHKLVDGKWVPTVGETGGEPVGDPALRARTAELSAQTSALSDKLATALAANPDGLGKYGPIAYAVHQQMQPLVNAIAGHLLSVQQSVGTVAVAAAWKALDLSQKRLREATAAAGKYEDSYDEAAFPMREALDAFRDTLKRLDVAERAGSKNI